MFMFGVLFSLATLPLCFSDQSKYAVNQSPKGIITAPVKELVISCSHSNPDFDMILWYRQTIGLADLTLVANVRFSTSAVEKNFESLYEVSGSGSSQSSLRVLTLKTASDSAVYFCAASSHSDENSSTTSTKT